MESVGFEPVPIAGRLQPGLTVEEALARLVSEAGCRGAVVTMSGGTLDRLHFVGPARADDGIHAAWYSETRSPPGEAKIVHAVAVVGWKEGAPFVHCHGHWQAGGESHLGHMLCERSRIGARPIRVAGHGSATASFESLPDAETRFTLFSPVGEEMEGGRAFFLRIRPHEDMIGAIETACRQRAISEGSIAGLGSLVGTRLADGRMLDGPATEILIEHGRLHGGAASLDIQAVDIEERRIGGALAGGDNPVCVTCELMIVADS